MFIFVLGFVMMTPQLYINYKLKSVDHLPWKTLIYRFISTIIDDIFVFMIDLPWLQRMFSFRDGNLCAIIQMLFLLLILYKGEFIKLIKIGLLCLLLLSMLVRLRNKIMLFNKPILKYNDCSLLLCLGFVLIS